jgi:hypothetical protein
MSTGNALPSPKPEEPRWRRVVRIAVPIAVLVGLVVWLLADAAREPTRLRLEDAHDAIVELPGGERVEAFAGLALPDGAVVRTGPGGRASAGGVTLGSDEVALVRDQALVATAGATPSALERVRPRTNANLRERRLTWGSPG